MIFPAPICAWIVARAGGGTAVQCHLPAEQCPVEPDGERVGRAVRHRCFNVEGISRRRIIIPVDGFHRSTRCRSGDRRLHHRWRFRKRHLRAEQCPVRPGREIIRRARLDRLHIVSDLRVIHDLVDAIDLRPGGLRLDRLLHRRRRRNQWHRHTQQRAVVVHCQVPRLAPLGHLNVVGRPRPRYSGQCPPAPSRRPGSGWSSGLRRESRSTRPPCSAACHPHPRRNSARPPSRS